MVTRVFFGALALALMLTVTLGSPLLAPLLTRYMTSSSQRVLVSVPSRESSSSRWTRMSV